MNTHFIKRIACLFLILCACLVCPMSAAAQGTEHETLEMSVTDSQIEAWLGREHHVKHPVKTGLEERDEASLHFYFTRQYGQRAESVIASAKKAKEKNLRFLPAETVENIHVYLLGNINEYFEALNSKGRAPKWAAGLTILRDGVILIRLAPSGTERIEPERTLAHELNHAALRRYAQDNYFPHWFYEGLAMTATDDWNLSRAETIAKAAMAGQLLDLEGIDLAFGKQGTIVDLAYAESAHFVSWLAKDHGDEAVKKLISTVAAGTSFDQAFTDIFGRSPNAAFTIWRDSMSREKSLFASFFSHDGLFFLISIFAAIALVVALRRRSAIRKRRLAAMNTEIPDTVLPSNLRNFGPFKNSK